MGKIIIIGGGASGMMTGIVLARRGHGVCILEGDKKIGRKLLATGNGRCNFTNAHMSSEHFHSSNPKFPLGAINRFDHHDAIDFFESIGVPGAALESGRMYPMTFDAQSLLQGLLLEMNRLSVETRTNTFVKNIKRTNSFEIMTQDGERIKGDAVVLATGGVPLVKLNPTLTGYDMAMNFGHRMVTPRAGIVQLELYGKSFKGMKGAKCDAEVTVFSDGKERMSFREDVLFADYGITGTAILQVSSVAVKELEKGREVYLSLNLLPGIQERDSFLEQRFQRSTHLDTHDFLVGLVREKMIDPLLIDGNLNPRKKIGTFSQEEKDRLKDFLQNWKFKVKASKEGEAGQVTIGGIDTRDVNPGTMESKLIDGLYFTGEILDVDGDCGGYNLQWAWSSGYVCGSSI